MPRSRRPAPSLDLVLAARRAIRAPLPAAEVDASPLPSLRFAALTQDVRDRTIQRDRLALLVKSGDITQAQADFALARASLSPGLRQLVALGGFSLAFAESIEAHAASIAARPKIVRGVMDTAEARERSVHAARLGRLVDGGVLTAADAKFLLERRCSK